MIGLKNKITQENATTIYYLLYSYYGNSHILSSDTFRFKYNLFSIIWMYAPSWVKRVEIQDQLRELTIEDLREGSKSILNHSINPSSEPGTGSDRELPFISDQNVSKVKTSYAQAYNNLMILLRTDVTKEFINLFKKLFVNFCAPPPVFGFVSDCEYDIEDGEVDIVDGSNGVMYANTYDTYQTKTFTEIYPSLEDFIKDWEEQ